jgi:hypothetical protein
VDKKLFVLGQVMATRNVLKALAQAGVDPAQLLARHQTGDWGELPRGDIHENHLSLRHGWRLFSSYPIEDGGARKVWVITEADRSVTTILLPEDY